MRVAKSVELSSDDDRRLRILSKRKRVEARAQLRARIVLLAADGTSDMDIAAALNIDRRVAARWRARFLAAGVDGLLQDAGRPGRPWLVARRGASRSSTQRARRGERGTGGAHHFATKTCRGDALEHAHAGGTPRYERLQRGENLARPWPQAPSRAHLQVVQ